MNDEWIKQIVEMVVGRMSMKDAAQIQIPVEVSARHVHLCQRDLDLLFGPNYRFTPTRELSQPGQYACRERVKLVTAKGEFQSVAVLGPVRDKTQVELSLSDARVLGISVPINQSGDTQGAADVFIIGEKGMVCARGAAIAAKAHIHMSKSDADRFLVSDNQTVNVRLNSLRPLVMENVVVRVSDNYSLALHIDTDEANGAGYINGMTATIETGIDINFGGKPPYSDAIPIDQERISSSALSFKGLVSEKAVLDWSKKGVTMVKIEKGSIITPLARDLCRENRITLSQGG